MTDITPPPELVLQWVKQLFDDPCDPVQAAFALTKLASQYGADQELEACCEWLSNETLCESNTHRRLRAARRPKPPSLKEQSLALIDLIQGNKKVWDVSDLNVIRRALERLP